MKLNGITGDCVRGDNKSDNGRGAVRKIGRDVQCAVADQRHVGHPHVVGAAQQQRERLTGQDRSIGRRVPPDFQTRRLVRDHGDNQLGKRPVIAITIGGDGTNRGGTGGGQCHVGAIGDVGCRSHGVEILSESNAGARFVRGEKRFDGHGAARDRRFVVSDPECCYGRANCIQGRERDDERLIGRKVASQVSHAAHRHRVDRIHIERGRGREGQDQAVQADIGRAGGSSFGPCDGENEIRAQDGFVEGQAHHRARINLNCVIAREDRDQLRRVLVGGCETRNERRDQRSSNQVHRTNSGCPACRILPLAVDHDYLVSDLAAKRTVGRQAHEARNAIGRIG